MDLSDGLPSAGRLKVLHVVAGLAAGGVGTVVPQMCRELARQGLCVTLATVAGPGVDCPVVPGMELASFRSSRPHTLFFSWEMARRLDRLVQAADVVHIHSNWTFPVWWAGLAARRRRKPFVMTPHGCLLPERLRVSAARKRLAGALFDRLLLRRAALLHATSDLEAESFRDYGLRNRVVVIPNGVEYAPEPDASRVPAGRRCVLALGRIHAIKGLINLVRAWAEVKAHMPAASGGWHVVIAGPDERGHRRELEAEARRLNLTVADAAPEDAGASAADIVFTGPVQGAEKWRLYRAADLFVLPSLSENFGLVVPEALNCGVPVIATRATPWAELEGDSGRSEDGGRAGRCGWWIDVGVAPLSQALHAAMELSDEQRRDMGRQGRRLAATKYRWSAAAAQMKAAYETMCPRPFRVT